MLPIKNFFCFFVFDLSSILVPAAIVLVLLHHISYRQLSGFIRTWNEIWSNSKSQDMGAFQKHFSSYYPQAERMAYHFMLLLPDSTGGKQTPENCSSKDFDQVLLESSCNCCTGRRLNDTYVATVPRNAKFVLFLAKVGEKSACNSTRRNFPLK